MKPHAPWHRRVTHRVRNEFLRFTTGTAPFCYQSSAQGEHVWPHTPGDAQNSTRSIRFTSFPGKGADLPRLPQGWLHHTTAGLRAALSQLTQSPAKANKTFLISRFSSGLPRSLVGEALKWEAGRIRLPPTVSHRNRPPFLRGQVISATKKGVLCLNSVTNQQFHTQRVGSWSCLQTTLSKGLSALSLWTGTCKEELETFWPKEDREGILKIVDLKAVQQT